MDNDDNINTATLMVTLLTVMPACWLDKLAERIAHLYGDTGYGEVTLVVYRGRVVQINEVIKDR